MNDIIVFVDGSCSNNGYLNAKGGIGIHFPNAELKDISKLVPLETCTNQKSELYAILFCIKYINKYLGLKDKNLIIKTDSEYSINCITKWAKTWVSNGWKKKNGEDVLNKNYIESIYKLYKKNSISFQHIAAHTGNIDDDSIGNDIADSLAKKSIETKTTTVGKLKKKIPESKKEIPESKKEIPENISFKKKEINVQFLE